MCVCYCVGARMLGRVGAVRKEVVQIELVAVLFE
jgi:hypothetical protein